MDLQGFQIDEVPGADTCGLGGSRSSASLAAFETNSRRITPEHDRNPAIIRDQRTKPDNKIHNRTKSAKPPSPVQIRAAPPSLNRSSPASRIRRESREADFSPLSQIFSVVEMLACPSAGRSALRHRSGARLRHRRHVRGRDRCTGQHASGSVPDDAGDLAVSNRPITWIADDTRNITAGCSTLRGTLDSCSGLPFRFPNTRSPGVVRVARSWCDLRARNRVTSVEGGKGLTSDRERAS